MELINAAIWVFLFVGIAALLYIFILIFFIKIFKKNIIDIETNKMTAMCVILSLNIVSIIYYTHWI